MPFALVIQSRAPWIVEIGDGARWLVVFLGIIVGVLYAKYARTAGLKRGPGTGLRMGGAAFSALYISATEFDRLHTVVTLRLLLGVVAMLMLSVGLWRMMDEPSLEQVEREVKIRSLEQTLASLQHDVHATWLTLTILSDNPDM